MLGWRNADHSHARYIRALGNAGGSSYTLFSLYYMYCLRHFRPTHLFAEGASVKLSAFVTWPVVLPAGLNKQQTDGGSMAMIIAPPVAGYLVASRRRCGASGQALASHPGGHGACTETTSAWIRTVCLRLSEYHTATGRYPVASQAASTDCHR